MNYIKRNIQKDIDKFLFDDDIIIITGSRQSGKTSLLKYYFNKLKNKNKSYFYNLEDYDYLNLFNKTPKNIFKLVNLQSNTKIFVFIDEIQYLNNPTNFLKYLYDEYIGKIKFIVSGSSTFYMDRKFKDSLAGRKKIFQLTTLNFSEFLLFKKQEELKKIYDEFSFLKKKRDFNIIDKKKIDILLNEYMIYGGYPRVVLEENKEKKIILLNELANSYVKKDAFENNINYMDKFISLFKILSSQIGSLVNKNELANQLNVSTTMIDNYLYIMLKSFHLVLLHPFFNNIRKELRKMKKVYFMDLGLRNYFMNNFNIIENRQDKGELYENFIFKELLVRYGFDNLKFWRTQNNNEVDFIINNQNALEVKYNFDIFKITKYKTFIKNYPTYNFNVISHIGKKNEINGIEIIKL